MWEKLIGQTRKFLEFEKFVGTILFVLACVIIIGSIYFLTHRPPWEQTNCEGKSGLSRWNKSRSVCQTLIGDDWVDIEDAEYIYYPAVSD